MNAGLLQAKLRIGPAGDSFEREADRMADAVLRMPEPVTEENTSSVGQAQSDNVQRVCSECEEELRRQPMENKEDDELLQAKASTNVSPPVNAGVESSIASLHGGGRPLPPAQRSFFGTFQSRLQQRARSYRWHCGRVGPRYQGSCLHCRPGHRLWRRSVRAEEPFGSSTVGRSTDPHDPADATGSTQKSTDPTPARDIARCR